MKYLSILYLLILTGCGLGSEVSSPHGEDLPEDTCETRWEFRETVTRCVPEEPNIVYPEYTQVDEALKSIVEEYVDRSGNSLPSKLTYIKLTDKYEGTSIIGGCITFRSGNREIRIKRSYWNSQSENKKKNLMFHELGHCVEDLDHTFSAGNGRCSAQFADNTVRVMDACDEQLENRYVIDNEYDWTGTYFAGSYTRPRIPVGYMGHKLPDIFNDNYYHILLNSYSPEDTFKRFFNEED